jgi:hypothetical protein
MSTKVDHALIHMSIMIKTVSEMFTKSRYTRTLIFLVEIKATRGMSTRVDSNDQEQELWVEVVKKMSTEVDIKTMRLPPWLRL